MKKIVIFGAAAVLAMVIGTMAFASEHHTDGVEHHTNGAEHYTDVDHHTNDVEHHTTDGVEHHTNDTEYYTNSGAHHTYDADYRNCTEQVNTVCDRGIEAVTLCSGAHNSGSHVRGNHHR